MVTQLACLQWQCIIVAVTAHHPSDHLFLGVRVLPPMVLETGLGGGELGGGGLGLLIRVPEEPPMILPETGPAGGLLTNRGLAGGLLTNRGLEGGEAAGELG